MGVVGCREGGGVFRREGEPPPVGRLPPDWPRVTQPAILIGPRNRTHPAMAALSVCTRQLRSFPGNPPASPFPPPPLRLVQHALAFLPLWSSPTRPPRPRSLRQVHPPRTGARRGTRLSLSLHGLVVIVESRPPPRPAPRPSRLSHRPSGRRLARLHQNTISTLLSRWIARACLYTRRGGPQ